MLQNAGDDDLTPTEHEGKAQCLGEKPTRVHGNPTGPNPEPKARATAFQVKEISAAGSHELVTISLLTLNLGLSQVNDSVENFKRDIRSEIKQEMQGVEGDQERYGGDEGDEQAPEHGGGDWVSERRI